MIWTALVTPFLKDGSIDWKAYDDLVNRQIDALVHGIVICGTTGESPTLSREEKQKLILRALELCRGTPINVMAGTGSNSTEETIEFSKWAAKHGSHSLLVVTPYYNKPQPKGLIAHYHRLADSAQAPIYVYHVPARTGLSVSAEVLAEILNHPNIAGIKESSGVSVTLELLSLVGSAKKDILCGDDELFFPLAAAGANGVVSVASNVVPKEMVKLGQLLSRNDLVAARVLNLKLYPLFKALFLETNPVPAKAALAEFGLCSSTVRSPLSEMERAHLETLRKVMKGFHS